MSDRQALEPTNGARDRQLSTLDAETMEKLVVGGDLSKLSPEQRLQYYRVRCENAGLDPAAQPFAYIVLNGKMVLYALKGCSEQLTVIHGIQLGILEQKTEDGMRTVTVRVTTADGRVSEDIGSVSVAKLSGDVLANALMKCVTKAKRRAILSVCGLGALDESELETIPNARQVRVDPATGDILDEGDRPYADRKPRAKPHASAVGPREHLDRNTGELTALDDPKEEARLQKEELHAFLGGEEPSEAEIKTAFGMEPDETPPVRDVLGVPVTLGVSFKSFAGEVAPGMRGKTWFQMSTGLRGGAAEKALRHVLKEAQDICENGSGVLSEFHQRGVLTLAEMLRLRAAKDAEEATAIDLIAERESK